MREIVFSVDIETLGDIPGVSSMLSLGCVAFHPELDVEIGRFSVNFDRLPGDIQTKGNKAFWDRFPEAFAMTRTDTVEPVVGMLRFRDFVRDLCAEYKDSGGEDKAPPAKAVCLAYPAAWDFGTWIFWYFNRFLGEDSSPFRHRALDLRTVISQVLNIPYSEAHISKVPKEWMPEVRRNRVQNAEDQKLPVDCGADHIALDDAAEQGYMYLALRKRWREIVQRAALSDQAVMQSLINSCT